MQFDDQTFYIYFQRAEQMAVIFCPLPLLTRPNYTFTKVASFIAILTGKWHFILAPPQRAAASTIAL